MRLVCVYDVRSRLGQDPAQYLRNMPAPGMARYGRHRYLRGGCAPAQFPLADRHQRHVVPTPDQTTYRE